MSECFGRAVADGIIRDAQLSECGRYRFRLTRCWDDRRPMTVWVMLNPSTADASVDDPTIRRCMGFARAWGMGGIYVVNLFPWRATDPRDLAQAGKRFDIAFRAERDYWIRSTLLASNTAPIAAWGAHKLAAREARTVLPLAPRWMAMGLTKAGAPRHPLYLRGDTKPMEWMTMGTNGRVEVRHG